MMKQKFITSEPEIPSFKVDFDPIPAYQVVTDFCDEYNLTLSPNAEFAEVSNLKDFIKDVWMFTSVKKKFGSRIEAYECVLNFFSPYFSLAYVKKPNPNERDSSDTHVTKQNFAEKLIPVCFQLRSGRYKYFHVCIRASTIKQAGMGAYAVDDIPKGAISQYQGIVKSISAMNPYYSWEVQAYDVKGKPKVYGKILHYVDATSLEHSNWARYVNCGPSSASNNFDVFQKYDKIFYRATRNIESGEELFIDYGEGYRTDNLGIDDSTY